MANRLFEVDGFWDRVETACVESGMSKLQIADKMGVERKALYERSGSWHSGRLVTFCKITHVSADWLLGLSSRKTVKNRAGEPVKFRVIDTRTNKEPIFDGNHVFQEKWFKASSLLRHDISSWALDEDGNLMLTDDCGNVAYPPFGRFKVELI